jgi:hypothetical protein
MKRMTKARAAAFRARWQLVNDFEREEALRASYDDKYLQFWTLLQWARAFGWEKDLAREDDLVRARWMKLRKAYRGKKAKRTSAH